MKINGLSSTAEENPIEISDLGCHSKSWFLKNCKDIFFGYIKKQKWKYLLCIPGDSKCKLCQLSVKTLMIET